MTREPGPDPDREGVSSFRWNGKAGPQDMLTCSDNSHVFLELTSLGSVRHCACGAKANPFYKSPSRWDWLLGLFRRG